MIWSAKWKFEVAGGADGIGEMLAFHPGVYLASHNRPIHEVLFPSLRDVQGDYTRGFQGMTVDPVPLEALLAARERMMQELQQGLDENERQFLLSLAAGNPEWTRLDIAHLDRLPGMRWKLHNLQQLRDANPRKFAEQADALATRLGLAES